MAERYGIIATFKAKEGKIDELIEICKDHFVRQLDGREPNAALATIIMPLPDDSNTVRLFEQWLTKDDYELHSKPNENLQVCLDKVEPIVAEAPVIIEAPMMHYAR
jgi:quinol monooxygenase YgiN